MRRLAPRLDTPATVATSAVICVIDAVATAGRALATVATPAQAVARTGVRDMQRAFSILALALAMQSAAAEAPQDATYAYMFCVRRHAELLEPSGDPPQDVARAAVFLCLREEGLAFNSDGRSTPDHLRNTAIFYGAAQTTVARACRLAQRCGLAPLSDPN
jgi:recombinational DNA repair protein (RecF pathway)